MRKQPFSFLSRIVKGGVMAKNSPRWAPSGVTILLLLLVTAPVPSKAQTLNVMTTTQDLASLVREVGGDRVKVEAIARGYQDPHFVQAKPSFLLKLNRADLLVLVGLQLETGWLPPLITRSRNRRIQVGAPGYLDASQSAVILQKLSGPVTRAMGDVHPMGNPHYWLDPQNGRLIAKAIQEKLTELQREDAAYFQQRYEDFERRLEEAEKRWEQQMAALQGTEVVTYHNSWPNFMERFGLQVAGYVEPKPGIPPSPRHILELIRQMRQDGIKAIIVEPYFDLKTPQAIARQTGAEVLVLLPSVGGVPEVTNYFQLFDYNIRLLTEALARQQ
ncbi:MAG: zinc ABC transporter substrate-binding protein [Acidobacteria bacterium]|nr:zinc ABC transporter substrate-binding protein [Acidobacteriota bacterium]